MADTRKVIITCAVTGSIHTPTMTPYIQITPDDIAAGAIGAAEAGAAILHLHARDPNDGRPTPDPKVFMQFLPKIKAGTDAVINITTGGGHNMTVQERLALPLAAKPEVCSLNMGSMNFGLYPNLMGGNVRVGLEDSIYVAKGKLAKSNAEQVAKIRRILEDLSLDIATPAEARKMLALKGSANVAF